MPCVDTTGLITYTIKKRVFIKIMLVKGLLDAPFLSWRHDRSIEDGQRITDGVAISFGQDVGYTIEQGIGGSVVKIVRLNNEPAPLWAAHRVRPVIEAGAPNAPLQAQRRPRMQRRIRFGGL
jgi:hypothetical protein